MYGRSLWFFLRHRWISALIWVVCLAGHGAICFTSSPSRFCRSATARSSAASSSAQEGSSPDQMHAYQEQVEEVMQANPAVDMTFTMTGNSSSFPSNQGFVLAFLKDPRQARRRSPAVAGQLMGAIDRSSPGRADVSAAEPVLQISTGATANHAGPVRLRALRRRSRTRCTPSAGKIDGRSCTQYPGFLFVNSDLFNHTPNLQIDILRDQAKLYGVSETRILSAAAQRLFAELHLPDQEAQRSVPGDSRSRTTTTAPSPQNLSLLYIKSDDGQRMVPLQRGDQLASVARAAVGESHQPVHQRHVLLQPEARLHHRRRPRISSEDAAKQILPPDIRGGLQGEALTFQRHRVEPDHPDGPGRLRDVRDPGILYESYLHPITVLSSLPVALVGGLLTLWLFHAEASLYAFIGMFMLMGIVKKNGIMIVDFAQQRVAQGMHGRPGHSRRQHGPLPAHHDDHAGGADGRAADRAGLRRRRRFAAAAGAGGRRRIDRFAVHHAVRHAGDLSLSRRIPGKGAGPHQLLPLDTRARQRRRSGAIRAHRAAWLGRLNRWIDARTRSPSALAIAADARVLALLRSAERLHGRPEVCEAHGRSRRRPTRN